jgi:hypothetical protein
MAAIVAHLSLADEADRNVAYGIPVPFIPRQGDVIVYRGTAWEVTSPPQILLGERTLAYHADDPVQVDVRVRPGRGIHEEPGGNSM